MTRRLVWIAVLGLLLGAIYAPTIDWMRERFTAPDSEYSHGFVVPILVAFVIWRQMRALAASEHRPSLWGLVLLVPGAAMQIVAAVLRVHFLSGFSLLPVLLGLVLLLEGWQRAKLLLFPIAFLAFMIPLPLVSLAEMSLRLKLFAASAGLALARVFGVTATQSGSVLTLGAGELLVGDACSGIRSLIALFAMGTLVGYLTLRGTVRRMAVALAAVPAAVLANGLRIALFLVIANRAGVEATTGFVHEATGIAIYVMTLGLLLLLARILRERPIATPYAGGLA
ncbi:MAG: exosortase/archaeosortase family protein [Planctomycetes bacterium]|nr:exosortase/archaeosortase family protein [Planctomycetota bacterium]